jgi:hypothetical protein
MRRERKGKWPSPRRGLSLPDGWTVTWSGTAYYADGDWWGTREPPGPEPPPPQRGTRWHDLHDCYPLVEWNSCHASTSTITVDGV